MIYKPRRRANSKVSEVEAHEDRQHDHDEDHGKNADHHRQREFCWKAVGFFLSARETLVAHVVAVDPERVGDARTKLFGLLNEYGERARLLQTEPFAQVVERVAHGAACADFEVSHMDVGGQRRIAVAEFAPDTIE